MARANGQAQDSANSGRFNVLIAGGGVAGLEAAFALREFADHRVNLTLLAPTDEFVYRPMTVGEPFAAGWAPRYPLSGLAEDAGAELVRDGLGEVDVKRRVALTTSGIELHFDALLVGLGASLHRRYEHVTSVDDARMDELLHGLIQDVEGGYVRRLAFVVPAPMPWPLPVYELALMTAERAWDMQADLAITILTPEAAPLAVFGEGVSQGLARLLAQRGIEVITSACCEIPKAKTISIHPGDRTLEVDRIVALPELRGPALPGLPHDPAGFIPVDVHSRVRGIEGVWAAGDATDFPVKHGGIAAQQADVAARSIAAEAGAPVELRQFIPVVEGILLTGDKPLHLRAEITGGDGGLSELTEVLRGSRIPMVAARYLAPHLLKHVGTPG
ncbi:MAG: FAD-dependent oxidoreductase [Actinomycetota bacterium]|nr:FAD-dependent oxidoreductase [Actinomycetota bacterium]